MIRSQMFVFLPEDVKSRNICKLANKQVGKKPYICKLLKKLDKKLY